MPSTLVVHATIAPRPVGPDMPPAALVALLIVAGVLLVWLSWSERDRRTGMAHRVQVRRTLGRAALKRSAAELRPSLKTQAAAARWEQQR